MRLDPAYIRRIADDLRNMLGEDFDQQTYLDTLDGETSALDVADWIICQMQESEALAAAAKAQAQDIAARASRIGSRADAFKGQLLTLLDAIGEKKLERPRATISRRAGSLSVQITDETSIPTQLCKVVKSPDKAAIKAQIEAGETVPGAELVRGADGITVRVK